MSRTHVPKALRKRVSAQSSYRCGYCLTSEAIVGSAMELDHLIPVSLGGLTVELNLWLACSPCNDHKGERISELDLLTGETVRPFNPRTQIWADHFRWTPAGDRIVGLTPFGRVTVATLNMNRPVVVRAHQAWVAAGWHPPR